MKTVILCGGKGRRLDQETEFKPKPLVTVGTRPILWHIMKIYSHQGFRDFILCLGYKGNMIKEYFLNLEEMSNDFILDLQNKNRFILSDNSDKSRLEARIYFINTGLESMTGSRVARIKKYIGGDENFFLTYGDAVSDIDLKELYGYHKRMGKIATITSVNPVFWFGLVELEGGIVKKFDEKPEMKDLVNGGFMVFNVKIFDYLSEEKNCVLEQDPLRKLAREGQLAAYQHKGFWKCMDNQKDVDELNAIYNAGAPWESWKNE